MSHHLEAIKSAVISGKHAEIKGLVQQALDAGVDPGTLINDALIAAMDVVGKDFGEGKIFVPEMLVSAMTMKSSPACGTSVMPWISTGMEGPADLMVLPFSSSMARTRPEV